MRTAKKIEGLKCPKCGSIEKQCRNGHNIDGEQIYKCTCCNNFYTIAPSKRYNDEIKQQAIRAYYSGMSGRAVGKLFGMSKANVFRWIKKTERSVDKS